MPLRRKPRSHSSSVKCCRSWVAHGEGQRFEPAGGLPSSRRPPTRRIISPMKKIILAVAVATLFAGVTLAQEHPEHPKSGDKAKAKSEHAYSMDELEKAITTEIETAQSKNGGSYSMKDGDKTWTMKLDHVHRERLAKLDPKTYFACTDFKSSD